MKIDRVVFDTNVLISAALLDDSPAARARDHAIRHARLVATEATLREFADKILLPKFDAYVSREARQTLAQSFQGVVELVQVVQIIKACRDPRDDKFLEAAVNGQAEASVTGDKDLLVLNPFAGILVLTPAEYLARVARGGQ